MFLAEASTLYPLETDVDGIDIRNFTLPVTALLGWFTYLIFFDYFNLVLKLERYQK